MTEKPMEQELPIRRKKGRMHTRKFYDTIFFWAIAAIPLFWWAYNWIVVNIGGIVLTFQSYDELGNVSWVGFANVKQVILDYMYDPSFTLMLKNSVVFYLISLAVTTTVPIIFSYYIFKNMWGSSFFKVIMFMPRIISGLCTVTIFKFLVERVIPTYFGMERGLLENMDTAFGTVVFYSLWLSFGGGLLSQVGAMNATDKTTIEAGVIDGVGFFGEFWHIVFPKSYQVILIGFYTGFQGLFTTDLGMYGFMGPNAPAHLSTVGYQYQVKMQSMAGSLTMADYPYWSAWGFCCSMICIPVTFLLRYLVEHIGAKEE